MTCTDFSDNLRSVAGSRWKPGKEVADAEASVDDRGMRVVCEGKFLSRSLQKQGVVEGCTPEPAADLVASGSFRVSDSTIRRTNGHGSIAGI